MPKLEKQSDTVFTGDELATRNWLLFLVFTALSCKGSSSISPTPKLASPSFSIPAVPELTLESNQTTSVNSQIKRIVPPKGLRWNVRFDYAAAQRAEGVPELDVHVFGTVVLTSQGEGEWGLSKVSFEVRPEHEELRSKFERSIESIVTQMNPEQWPTAGETTGGRLVVLSQDGKQGWAVVDTSGIVEAHYENSQVQTKKSMTGLQHFRYLVSLVRF